ncbi:hexokinase-4-like [Lytechinus pictus]|uniref:hexokinase-4-like n=1 Tax=Lytechinus pictus TaxID=7653 RepID=UPI0030BA1403
MSQITIQEPYWDSASIITKEPLASIIGGESEKLNRAQAVLKPFDISLELMKDIGVRLTKEMTKGLDKATHDEAKVKMFPTYVQSLPDGTALVRSLIHHKKGQFWHLFV